MRTSIALALLIVTPAVFAQAAGQYPANPSAAAQASPAAVPKPASSVGAPRQMNPASAPVRPASNAGATERGLEPVQPATGVTPKVRQAGSHDTDAQGHTLDPHGKPVGQAPAVPSTVH